MGFYQELADIKKKKKMKMKRIIIGLLVMLFSLGGIGCTGGEDILPAETFSELNGKVVAVIGKGSTPELIFKHLLSGNELEFIESSERTEGKVGLHYAADSMAAVALISAGKADYAVIAEPQVTGALKAINREKVSFDLQKEYDRINNNNVKTGYPQAVVMVKKTVLEQYGKTIENIQAKLKGAAEFVASDVAAAVTALKGAGATTLNELTKEGATRANVGLVSVERNGLEKYFNIILSSLEAIGGKMPEDGFYFSGTYTSGEASEKLKIFAPDGAPSISLAPIIASHDVKIVPPLTIASKMQTKEADLLIIPSNAAVNLYNKGVTDYACLGASSLGNLYLV